jgi:hypothetical protein
MDRRITIGLVVALALLGGYIWYTFLRSDAPPLSPVTPAPTEIAFLRLDRAQVTALQVREVANNTITRVVRDGEAWKMEQPLQGQAFGSRVDELLFNLARSNAERNLGAQSDLMPFGLNPPRYELQVTVAGAEPVTIALGNKNPDGNSYYALRGGDGTVYLVSSLIGQKIEEFVTMPPYTPTPTGTRAPTETPAATPTP